MTGTSASIATLLLVRFALHFLAPLFLAKQIQSFCILAHIPTNVAFHSVWLTKDFWLDLLRIRLVHWPLANFFTKRHKRGSQRASN